MNTEYWVWLQQVLGYASSTVHSVIENYGNAKAFYDAEDSEKIKRCRLSPSQSGRLHSVKRKTVYSILTECRDTGIDIITPESSLFPEALKNIPDMPAVLYTKGDASVLSGLPAVAVVGPRKPGKYGEKAAYVISDTLASCGFTIVSGGAVGGDRAAHRGAINGKGKTVAVLGCGINNDYLMENRSLRETISKNGCLVSEYPPSSPVLRGAFPQRNRLMSGLSNGVVVVEGGVNSGTNITARYAAEQGRDVFCIPGNPSDPHYAGSNKLIAEGARPLLSVTDIINEYFYIYPDKIHRPFKFYDLGDVESVDIKDDPEAVKSTQKVAEKSEPVILKAETEKTVTDGLSDIAKEVFSAIRNEKSFFTDTVVEKTELDLGSIMLALTELEINGIITAEVGGAYTLN